MIWEILCLTQPSRQEFRDKLWDNIGPQVRAHLPTVDFRYRTCDPTISLGENRDIMRHQSTADYISQIDDDDLVADDYVDRILPLLDGVDYIGFRLQAYEDGIALPKPTYHSLLCGGWFESQYGYHRDLSLLNPIRRELALVEPIHYDYGEDSDWAHRMRATGLVRTEHYIEQTMYHYLSRPSKTDGARMKRTAGSCPRCGSASTVFIDHERNCNACGERFP